MLEVTELPGANLPSELPSREFPPVVVRLVTIMVIILPLAGVIAAPFFVWKWGFHYADLGLFLGMYLVTGFGITIGFHRLFAHRAFESPMWIKFIWAVLGSMAFQGPMFQWVGLHRRHHQYSDTPEDPHSPLYGGPGVLGVLRGFWHAHIGWFFRTDLPIVDRYIKDLRASRALRVADALFLFWVLLGFMIPATVGGLITKSWPGFWSGLIWGGLVRLFVVHHMTWSINSACHLWGIRYYETNDQSRDNFVFGILGLGEGWHNTHHAFPTSARHGLRWWQFDSSYCVIRALALAGLAWDLKLPLKEIQIKARRCA